MFWLFRYFETCNKYLSSNNIEQREQIWRPLASVLSKSESSAVSVLSLTGHVSHCASPTNKQAAFLLSKYFITFHPEFTLPCDQANGQ